MQHMSSSVTIYVATMTGTADLVAEEIQAALEEEGAEVEVQPMDGLDTTAFAAAGLYLVVSSTYGQGDVPDNGQALAEALERDRPGLAHGLALIHISEPTRHSLNSDAGLCL